MQNSCPRRYIRLGNFVTRKFQTYKQLIDYMYLSSYSIRFNAKTKRCGFCHLFLKHSQQEAHLGGHPDNLTSDNIRLYESAVGQMSLPLRRGTDPILVFRA